MKTTVFISGILVTLAYFGLNEAIGQWSFNGTHIYNTNTGNVGIGINAPPTLLCVAKNTAEPTITIRNLGGTGGASYSMIDDAGGANWKFKATLSGGFKVRDQANGLDVIVIEPNSFANAIYLKNTGNIGIGTATPAMSALVDMVSTSKGFLPPRMTQAQIGSISSPANGLVVFSTTNEKFYAYIASAGAWKVNVFGSGTISPFSCGSSITINHVAGNVAPVNKTVTYGTVLTNLTGNNKCWITQNLGANQQATAVNDATEASAGWYWQFNRRQGYKHDGINITPGWTVTSINEHSDWLAANDPCSIELGSNWRIPTYTEWANMMVNGGWGDWNGPWNSALKMHAAGALDLNGSLVFRGSFGDYWSSSQGNDLDGGLLELGSSSVTMFSYEKAYGFSVRCIEAPPEPPFICPLAITINHIAGNVAPVNKTVTYGTATNIPGEPSKCWITKNLGADHQATSANDTTEASAGWYWQFNRMQGYKHDGTTLTPAWPTTIIMENFDWEAANDPCAIELGFGWHVPTYTEWTNVKTAGGWTNSNGPWNSALRMHAAGELEPSNGALNQRGSHGWYGSRNQVNDYDAYTLVFNSGICFIGNFYKSQGNSIRCVR